MCSCRLSWSCNFLVAALWSTVVVAVVIVVVLIIVILCNVFCFAKSSKSARLPQFGKLTTSKQQFKDVTKRQSNFVRPGFFQKWNVLYTICYILYSMLYLISVFQYYIRIYDISNLILRISNPASGFMFCLLIIIMIVYLFWRDCNYNYSNCSRTLLILNLNLIFAFFCFSFFSFFWCFFFCFFFWGFFLHFDLLFFWGCFFALHFSHFFTNKLIFKFIGFWLTGCHNLSLNLRPSSLFFASLLNYFLRQWSSLWLGNHCNQKLVRSNRERDEKKLARSNREREGQRASQPWWQRAASRCRCMPLALYVSLLK